MAKILLDDEINKLNIDKDIEEKLVANGFKLIRDIWVLKRANLKELGFSDKEIKGIIIHLQLCGYDLNKKKYN